ncbi:MAG: hypothetical protein K8T90_16565 [Planctomycetes bacterium]|nr:hypothetical protein [Planctomycetota bacterium]
MRLSLVAFALSIVGAAWTSEVLASDPPPVAVPPKEVVRKVSGPAATMAASPDGEWLAVAGIASEVVLFSTKTDRRSVVAQGDAKGLIWRNLVFTGDSAFFAIEPYPADSGACVVDVIDVTRAQKTFSIDCSSAPQDRARQLSEVAPGPRGSQLLVRRFRVTESWDARKAERTSSETYAGDAYHVHRSGNPETVLEDRGREIVLVGAATSRDRWRIDATTEVAAPKGHKLEDAVHDRHASIAGVTTDGRLLVLLWHWQRGPKGHDSLGEVRQVAVYSMWDGKVAWTRESSAGGVRAIAAGDGFVAIAAGDTVEFLEAATGKARGTVAVASGTGMIVPAHDGRAIWVNTLDGQILKVAPPSARK